MVSKEYIMYVPSRKLCRTQRRIMQDKEVGCQQDRDTLSWKLRMKSVENVSEDQESEDTEI